MSKKIAYSAIVFMWFMQMALLSIIADTDLETEARIATRIIQVMVFLSILLITSVAKESDE